MRQNHHSCRRAQQVLVAQRHDIGTKQEYATLIAWLLLVRPGLARSQHVTE